LKISIVLVTFSKAISYQLSSPLGQWNRYSPRPLEKLSNSLGNYRMISSTNYKSLKIRKKKQSMRRKYMLLLRKIVSVLLRRTTGQLR
jgi:hypothetical protein